MPERSFTLRVPLVDAPSTGDVEEYTEDGCRRLKDAPDACGGIHALREGEDGTHCYLRISNACKTCSRAVRSRFEVSNPSYEVFAGRLQDLTRLVQRTCKRVFFEIANLSAGPDAPGCTVVYVQGEYVNFLQEILQQKGWPYVDVQPLTQLQWDRLKEKQVSALAVQENEE